MPVMESQENGFKPGLVFICMLENEVEDGILFGLYD